MFNAFHKCQHNILKLGLISLSLFYFFIFLFKLCQGQVHMLVLQITSQISFPKIFVFPHANVSLFYLSPNSATFWYTLRIPYSCSQICHSKFYTYIKRIKYAISTHHLISKSSYSSEIGNKKKDF